MSRRVPPHRNPSKTGKLDETASVWDLQLTQSVKLSLRDSGIATIARLKSCTNEELLKVWGFGKTTIARIDAALEKAGHPRKAH